MADTASIDGSNGTFEIKTNNDLSNPLAPSITIDYTVRRENGKPKVRCAKIVFVQTVKSTIGGTVVKPPSTLHNPDVRRGNHSDPDQTAAGVYVDHFFCSADPYYNQDAADQGTTEGDGRPVEMYDCPSFDEAVLPQPPATGTNLSRCAQSAPMGEPSSIASLGLSNRLAEAAARLHRAAKRAPPPLNSLARWNRLLRRTGRKESGSVPTRSQTPEKMTGPSRSSSARQIRENTSVYFA